MARATTACFDDGQELVLADGARALVWKLRAGDTETVRETFEGLGERSRRQRFGVPKSQLGRGELEALAAVDHCEHEAVVAVDPSSGQPIAIARFVRDRLNRRVAEVAYEVVDAWQGRRLGSRLAELLACRAREEGVERLHADVGADNRRSQAVLRRLGRVVEARHEGPSVQLVVELGG